MTGVAFTFTGSVVSAFVIALKCVVLGVVSTTALLVLYVLARLCIYRPAENHVGVIYRCGRLNRLVDPDGWTLIVPVLEHVETEVDLFVRRTPVHLNDLLTQDRVPVDCEFLVLYRLDLRQAGSESLLQALRIPEEGWNSIIKTVLRAVSLEVVGGIPLDELLGPAGYGHLELTVSAHLSDRLKDLGLVINAERGASVQRVMPAPSVRSVITDASIADREGKAALGRLLPLLDDLSQRDPTVIREVLRTALASVTVREGTVPDAVLLSDILAGLSALLGRLDRGEVAEMADRSGLVLPNGGSRRRGRVA